MLTVHIRWIGTDYTRTFEGCSQVEVNRMISHLSDLLQQGNEKVEVRVTVVEAFHHVEGAV